MCERSIRIVMGRFPGSKVTSPLAPSTATVVSSNCRVTGPTQTEGYEPRTLVHSNPHP